MWRASAVSSRIFQRKQQPDTNEVCAVTWPDPDGVLASQPRGELEHLIGKPLLMVGPDGDDVPAVDTVKVFKAGDWVELTCVLKVYVSSHVSSRR